MIMKKICIKNISKLRNLKKLSPRPLHLTSEVCLDMVRVGLNPLIREHYFKYLAWLDEPESVKLWEGLEWEFKLTDEQFQEIDNLVKELGDVSDEVRLRFINDIIEDYLPEVKILPTDPTTKALVEKMKDPPLYFKTNKSFFDKLAEHNENKRIKKEKIGNLVFSLKAFIFNKNNKHE